MNEITTQTPGVLPLATDAVYYGKVLVLPLNYLGARYRKPAYQLVKAMGGFGCEPDKLGAKVFCQHLADNDESTFRRNDFIGEASQELIDQIMNADREPMPVVPENLVFIAIGTGCTWGRGTTEKEARNQLKKAGGSSCIVIYQAHEFAYVNDMGGLSWPHGAPEPVEVYRNPKFK
jgi:hypothetical protein